ncbi:DUF3867 domain-containing protein [Clostridium botulinum]|uniref:DUF3867 domain-containing protein n=1 Tax=unclassified Clostridium TaxID=2614128 RepID=UPI000505099B|nr:MULTISPECIES: DUF3867 domain-containing protein [unclassified Clostridium]AIY78838.1 hypothetical protein U728_1818 [Clostridium botulinum 202F]KAI3347844.1 DUF3867 domain-containing protein [Clostridium botulinum]KFX53952.1 toxin-antitoxin system toxin component, PIN family protein [Clostridium botulinum]KFX57057.1 toxin-antitoxin system toxin component, PIN family protein [Clostridium botulinum]KON14595.1 toxin-antitoxin system toxin component, PIN family protein [Clostridium botulinum]
MDDKIIDFNELKNKAKDKDVDKFESYIYSMYYELAAGNLTMQDFSKNIMTYMEENNISQDKLLNIQKKFLERYGIDSSMIEEQLKMAGINLNQMPNGYESIRKTMGFQEKYKSRIKIKTVSEYKISNEKNNLTVLIEEDKMRLISPQKIDLSDNELNEFICSYKKVMENEKLKVVLSENIKSYEY